MLPTGTVTFCFTDIEDSTGLAERLGPAVWPDTLEAHRRIVRSALAAHDGQEVQTEGDGFFAVFPTASGAVAAAVAITRGLYAHEWPTGGRVRVRIGLHTGEGVLDADRTYVGPDVHRAARVASAGHGGQVVLSEATATLVRAGLPEGVRLRLQGEHRLRGLAQPERLFDLAIEDLPSEFPPLRTVEATPTNLPAQRTSFLGREAELRELAELVGRSRLVTLTGPGGTGKTRLAIELGSRLLDRFEAGVFFVPLATIVEPDLVPATIAQMLGMADRGGVEPVARVVDWIAGRPVLLILDNFEQVVAAAPVVAELLERSPRLAVVVTSRAVLHLSGEREYPVEPLRLPEPRAARDPAVAARFEAVGLFVERAQAARPAFRLSADNVAAVVEICRRLEGLPLAIELAAARIRLLPPEAVLSRLGGRLDLLETGTRDAPARQRTLRATIAWSHDLLEPDPRRLFACLAIFTGGASLDAVEAVCGPEVEGDILGALESLVDQSLVRPVDPFGDEPRFAMLETIREYAHERLAESGRLEDVRARHAAYFCRLAATAQPRLMSGEGRAWLDRLEADRDNLRAAFGWAVEQPDPTTVLRFVANLWRFWQIRGYLAEGMERARQALAHVDRASDPDVQARALEAAGGLAYWLGRMDEAERWYGRLVENRRSAGDERGLADALYNLSFPVLFTGRPDEGARLGQEALETFRRLGDRSGLGRALWALANALIASRRWADARRYAEEAEPILREVGDAFLAAWNAYTLGTLDLVDRRLDGARARFAEALRAFVATDDVSGYVLVLDALALADLLAGDRVRAARLSGAVARLERDSGTGLNPMNREILGFDPTELRTDPATAAAWAEGEELSAEQAIAYALEPMSASAGATLAETPASSG